MKWSAILQSSVTHAAAAVIATITIAAFLHHMVVAAKQSTIDAQTTQIATLKEDAERLRGQLGEAGPFELLASVAQREPVRLGEGFAERVVFDIATTENTSAHKPAKGAVSSSAEPILSEPIEFQVDDVTDRFIVMCTFGKQITVHQVRVAKGGWLEAEYEPVSPGTSFPCRVRSRTHVEITDASGDALQRKQLDDGLVTQDNSLAAHSYAYVASGMIQVSGLRLGRYRLQLVDSTDLMCDDENNDWDALLDAARHDLRVFLWRL
jgi:hypothetical protein